VSLFIPGEKGEEPAIAASAGTRLHTSTEGKTGSIYRFIPIGPRKEKRKKERKEKKEKRIRIVDACRCLAFTQERTSRGEEQTSILIPV